MQWTSPVVRLALLAMRGHVFQKTHLGMPEPVLLDVFQQTHSDLRVVFQAAVYSDLDSYLKSMLGLQAAGSLMCVLALVVWYLTVAKEVSNCVRLINAVITLPREASLRLEDDEEGHTQVAADSAAHMGFVLAVQCTRLGIAIALCYAGALSPDTANLLTPPLPPD